ncbi:MAG TPA: YkgJ family cysteine cluster protein [Nannocystis exedens]|nr:YkgJ family cysteine cluster protein [Nannocystis exedens]
MAATPAQLRTALVQLRDRVDDHFEAAFRRTPTAFACAEGCESCCHQRFSIFEIEAELLRSALAEIQASDPVLRQRIRDQASSKEHRDRCALLVDGRCSIYEARPMICRSHGLPIAVEGADGPKLDCCPLNFRAPSDGADGSKGSVPPRRRFTPEPPARSILRLDAVNQPLALLGELWHRTTENTQLRVELAQLAAEQ